MQRLGHFKFKKDAVNAALQEYVERHKQVESPPKSRAGAKELIELFGTIDYFDDYHYKEGRKKR